MTSWKRGEKNEDKGEKLMKSPKVGEKAKGVALKVAGELEQGVDNVRDRVTGKQDTLKGSTSKASTRSRSTGRTSKSGSKSTGGASKSGSTARSRSSSSAKKG